MEVRLVCYTVVEKKITHKKKELWVSAHCDFWVLCAHCVKCMWCSGRSGLSVGMYPSFSGSLLFSRQLSFSPKFLFYFFYFLIYLFGSGPLFFLHDPIHAQKGSAIKS